MSKRNAERQINHLEDEDDYDDSRDPIDQAKVADKAVLATRKIAKPRARRTGTTTSSLPLPSPISSFGSVADASSPAGAANPFAGVAFSTSSFGAKPSTTESKPANPFAGITSTTGPASTTPAFSFKGADTPAATTPAFSFKPQQTATPVASTFSFKPAEPASTPSSFSFKPAGATSTPSTTFNFKPAESKPEPAPAFSFKPAETKPTESAPPAFSFKPTENKPASQPAAFSFKGTDAASTTTPPALFKPAAPVTSTFGVPASKPDSSEDDKKLKFRALNEKFSAAFNEQLKNNIYGDLSVVLQAYLTFAKDIKSNTTPAAKPAVPAPAPVAAPKAAEPESSDDDEEEEKKSTEVKGPQFVMKDLPKSKSKGPFLFGKEAEARAKRLAAENSDSEDEVEVKGPQFTMNVVPTTSSSVFSFKPAAPKEDTEKKETPAAAPVFKFGEAAPAAAPAATPSTPFKFGAANGTSAASENNHTWTPDKGIKFGTSSTTTTTTTSTTDSAPKPAFSFGGAAPAPAADKKPMFSFGASAPVAAAATGDSAKPAPFKFGSTTPATGAGLFGASTDSPASKPFSFGASTASTDKSTENAAPKPFSFGAAPAAAAPGSAAPPTGFKFSFGGDNKAAPSGPSLFGAPTSITPTATGLFGSSAPASQSVAAPASADADADGETPADPQGADLTGKGPGEENEESMYEKKSRVYEIKDGKPEVLGLGILRVLTHNDTKKTRVLVRAEGSGRVIINVLLRDKLKYTAAGNQVKIMDFKADGTPTTYLVRVKTADDGAELSRVMEQQKVLGA